MFILKNRIPIPLCKKTVNRKEIKETKMCKTYKEQFDKREACIGSAPESTQRTLEKQNQ